MRALLISRPGDFGVLEDHWPGSSLTLPLPGGPLWTLHAASLARLNVTEVRVLRCHPVGSKPDLGPLETALAEAGLDWSVRPWPLGPWPEGLTLHQAVDRQRLFLQGDEALVWSLPAPDPRGWVGPKVPAGFPQVSNRALVAWVVDRQGNLTEWSGPTVSLAGTRDFYRSSLRLLETLPPPALVLRGIHRQANLEPPLALGHHVKAGSHSRLGPLVHLADGSRLDPGATLARTLVLTPTHFAKHQEIEGKIIVGHRVIEPDRGDVAAFPS